MNAKFQALLGAHKFTAFYNFTDRTEGDYADFSLARFEQSGRDWDQFSNWATAKTFATGETPDEAYFHSAARGAPRSTWRIVSAEFRSGDRARSRSRPYLHTQPRRRRLACAELWVHGLSPDPIYFRQTQYHSERMA